MKIKELLKEVKGRMGEVEELAVKIAEYMCEIPKDASINRKRITIGETPIAGVYLNYEFYDIELYTYHDSSVFIPWDILIADDYEKAVDEDEEEQKKEFKRKAAEAKTGRRAELEKLKKEFEGEEK